jgi:hypothetical protein
VTQEEIPNKMAPIIKTGIDIDFINIPGYVIDYGMEATLLGQKA